MRRGLVVGAVLAACAAGCAKAPGPAGGLAARAGGQALSVTRLAQLAASAPDLPLRADVVESLAMRWVEFSLLGRHAAAGDRLRARPTILAVAWPDVRAAVVDSFRAVRLAGRVRVTPEQVDSAFRAPDARFLRQVLKRVPAGATARQRDSLRAVLAAVRGRLAAGGSWVEANAVNDDPRSRESGGTIGLVRRGETVPAFERAAFALAPGQLSAIVETGVGFHVIYRPTLAEVRDGFTAAIEARLAEPLDSAYGAELLAGRHVRLAPGAAEAVRYTVASPLRARGMDLVLATYDGGRFTVGDLARYLQFLPPAFHQQVQASPEGQLADLLRSFVVRELEWREASRARVTLPGTVYARIEAAYAQQMDRIFAATGLDPDSLAAAAATHGGRRELAARRVDAFLGAALRDPRLASALPPGLASWLLEYGDWEVFPPGIEKALVGAAMLRAAAADSGARGAR